MNHAFLDGWPGANCVIYYPAVKCGLINILLIVVLFLRWRSHNKVTFAAGKIVSSLYNFMWGLNAAVTHGAV